ncbi:MAG: alanine racemase [Proteobacteria bacterium]|nr:alanine racemase [Pseudomonadota bacterium]
MVTATHAGAILTIDLDAVAANYALLSKKSPGAVCAAVVKADAYGVGLEPVARRLAHEGCRQFFVAQLAEAVTLREVLDNIAHDSAIHVLNGPDPGTEEDFENCRAIPILNSLAQIALWSSHAKKRALSQTAVLHIDTGMARLGLTSSDIDELAADPDRLSGLNIRLVMSHLACAEERSNPLNERQRILFDDLRARLPAAPASLANSSGIFLGTGFHYDMVRPGASIYGISPLPDESNPMRQVINLKGKIIQIRVIDTDMTVGYGATHRATRPSRIATVAVGYGDGYPRHLGNRGHGYIGGALVPIVGRVSMDLTTFDISDVPESAAQPGMMIDLLNERHTVDDLAREADTIGYEILTNLGKRYQRRYIGAVDG